MARQADDRLRVLAALADPARLAVVDRLLPGDVSPGQLAEQLQMGSNLLAHHLQVLQDAGVVRRVRSEGDRRRSYVQLCTEDPIVHVAALRGQQLAVAPRVVFVCTANSARSQLAAAEWNRVSGIPATSAGTRPGPRVHPRAVATARRHGLTLSGQRPAGLDGRLGSDDLVVAVCDQAYEELAATRSPLHWSVRDPVPLDTDDAFDTAYRDISRRIHRLSRLYPPSEDAS